jgi:FkbM family methyltransferase
MSLPATAAATRPDYEVIEVMGVKLPLDPQVMSPHILEVIRAGEYERAEAKHLPKMIEPGDRLLELGGGIGFLSALVGLQGKAEAIVVVEANPDLVPLIEATHAMNETRSTVINAAVVGERKSETASFSLAADFWASSLAPHKRREIARVVEVPTMAVADLVREHRPTMMIIDVEGGEVELMPHLVLDGVRLVMMELHQKVIRPEGVRAVFDGFSRLGFYYDGRFSRAGVVAFSRLP